jgi:uncharacterized protein YfiM (DUF2279 family)
VLDGGYLLLDNSVSKSVYRFAELVQGIADSDLEREWVWGSYESEGVRFAYFRTLEQLRELAVKLNQARVAAGMPLSEAQGILAQYHAAYNDLQAVLLGVGSEYEDKLPAEGEWPLRRIAAHIVGADLGFYVVIKFSLDRHRHGEDQLVEIDDDTWLGLAGMSDSEIHDLITGPMAGLEAFHGDLHERVLTEFDSVEASELDIPTKYWEGEPMELRFRMHRFESHMRQHTIQMEKTLHQLGIVPSESQRLLRLIYAALAEAEGNLIGIGATYEAMLRETAQEIDERTEEIRAVLDG